MQCHYDTYGYNLVAQLNGVKRWLLFPPTEAVSPEPPTLDSLHIPRSSRNL